MNKSIHPAICYALIILCALFASVFMYNLSPIKYSDAFDSAPFKVAKKIPAAPAEEKIAAPNLADLVKNVSGIFNNTALQSRIKPTDGHFIFNEILSNSGERIAYAELSDCASQTHLYNDLKNLPKCDWDYSIKIIDTKTHATNIVYSTAGDAKHLAAVAVVFQPLTWTKNDRSIIISWTNIGRGGIGGAPVRYDIVNASGGEAKPLGSNATIFFDSYGQMISLTPSTQSNICELAFSLPPGRIAATNTETGESRTLVEEKNTLYALVSFNRITNTLTYKYHPAPDLAACSVGSDKWKEKTVKIVN